VVSIGRLIARFGCGVGAPAIQALDVRSAESGPQTVSLGLVPASDATVRPLARFRGARSRGVRFSGARFDRAALALPSVIFEIDDLTHAVMSLFSNSGLYCLPDHNSFTSLAESKPRAMATSQCYDQKCHPAIVRRRKQNLL